jgi:hypothetical protein
MYNVQSTMYKVQSTKYHVQSIVHLADENQIKFQEIQNPRFKYSVKKMFLCAQHDGRFELPFPTSVFGDPSSISFVLFLNQFRNLSSEIRLL